MEEINYIDTNEVRSASASFNIIAEDCVGKTVKNLMKEYNFSEKAALEIARIAAETMKADVIWNRGRKLNDTLEEIKNIFEDLEEYMEEK